MNGKKRLEYVDVARGIAMICIVLGHLGNDAINRVVFTFHLPIFFFISGYFLSERGTFKEFTEKKFRAYIVPYNFTCLVITLLALLKAALRHKTLLPEFMHWTWATIYAAGTTEADPFFGIVIGALWFLWATFWGTLILRAVSKLKPVCRIIIIGSVFTLCQLTAPIFWLPLDIQAGGTASLFMYLGWLLKKNQLQIETIRDKEVRFVGFVGALFIWFYAVMNFKGFYLVHDEIHNGIFDIIGGICGSILLLLLSYLMTKRTAKLADFLSWAGKYSLLFLSVHITELNLLPWNKIVTKAVSLTGIFPVTDSAVFCYVIIAKFLFIFIAMWILLKSRIIRKIYRY